MKSDRTIHEAKTKVLISCAVTAQLICVFVFAYVISRFPLTRNTAHIFQKTKVMDLEQRTSVVQTKIVELQRSPFARSKQDDSLEKL